MHPRMKYEVELKYQLAAPQRDAAKPKDIMEIIGNYDQQTAQTDK